MNTYSGSKTFLVSSTPKELCMMEPAYNEYFEKDMMVLNNTENPLEYYTDFFEIPKIIDDINEFYIVIDHPRLKDKNMCVYNILKNVEIQTNGFTIQNYSGIQLKSQALLENRCDSLQKYKNIIPILFFENLKIPLLALAYNFFKIKITLKNTLEGHDFIKDKKILKTINKYCKNKLNKDENFILQNYLDIPQNFSNFKVKILWRGKHHSSKTREELMKKFNRLNDYILFSFVKNSNEFYIVERGKDCFYIHNFLIFKNKAKFPKQIVITMPEALQISEVMIDVQNKTILKYSKELFRIDKIKNKLSLENDTSNIYVITFDDESIINVEKRDIKLFIRFLYPSFKDEEIHITVYDKNILLYKGGNICFKY